MNIANKITLSRVLMIPIFIALVLVRHPAAQYAALAVFLVAALTDSLDGYIARKYDMVSDFGKFLDPLADKLLVTAALTALADMGVISVWDMFIIIVREFTVTGLRLIAVNGGVVIGAGILGKIKTVVQIIVVSMALAAGNADLHWLLDGSVINVLVKIMVVITVISGIDYVYKNRKLLTVNQ